jgi:hypothetical protein
VDDYIRLNGCRIPSAAESQKDINLLPILILPYGVALDEDFAEFFQEMLDTLPTAWASATRGRSRLSLDCDPFDGASFRKGAERPGLYIRFDGHALSVSLNQVISGTFRIDLLTLDGRRIGNLYAGNPPRGTLRLGLDQVGRCPLASGTFLVRIRAGQQEYCRIVSSISRQCCISTAGAQT